MENALKTFAVTAWVVSNQKPVPLTVRKAAIENLKSFVPKAKTFSIPITTLKKVKKVLDATSHSEEIVDDAYDIGKSLANALKIVKQDTKISIEQQNLFASIGTFLRNPTSDAAYKRINNNIGIVEDSLIESIFSVDSNIDKNLQKKLTLLAKKLGGKGEKLALDEQIAAREDAKEDAKIEALYKEYLATNNTLNKQYKTAVVSLIRKNSGTPMLLSNIRLKLSRYGLPLSWWPNISDKEGFQIGVDKKGNPSLLTKVGYQVMQFPRGDATIKINPNYNHKTDNAYVFTVSVPGAKTSQMIYTHNFNARKRKLANSKVLDALPNVEKYVKKWEGDILKAKQVDTCMPALVAYLIYQLSARIGSPAGETAGEKTYGLSTLLNKHVKVTTKTITFSYIGKKGVQQTHMYEKAQYDAQVAKKVFELIEVLKARTSASQPLFTYKSGKAISGTEVNAYIKSTGMKITAHKLRHCKGSALFAAKISGYKIDPKAKNPQAIAEKFLKTEVFPEVGKLLGHFRADGSNIGTTASKAYISPKMQKDFFTNLGLKIPQWAAQLHGD